MSRTTTEQTIHLLCRAGDHGACPREFFNGAIQANDLCECDCHRSRLWKALQQVTDPALRQELERAIEDEKDEVRQRAYVGFGYD